MEKNELVAALLNHYIGVHYLIKKDRTASITELKNYLSDSHTGCGVCLCAHNGFRERIYGDYWVAKYCKQSSARWGKYPYYTEDKASMLRALKIRINNLQKELYG